MSELAERYKTCDRCVHDGDGADIRGSTCYLCKRNPDDHRSVEYSLCPDCNWGGKSKNWISLSLLKKCVNFP